MQQRRKRGGLFAKYAAVTALLVAVVLAVNAVVDTYFSYRDNTAALLQLQREKAASAAARIDGFVADIVDDVSLATSAALDRPAAQRGVAIDRLFDYNRAINEYAYVGSSGIAEFHEARLSGRRIGEDHSGHEAFRVAREGDTYVGPVEFVGGSEPATTIAVPAPGGDGVAIVHASLKRATDVVAAIDLGPAGHAYAVDREGRLVADPDINRVLRATDLSSLPQVGQALAMEDGSPTSGTAIGRAADGSEVLSAYATAELAGWHVFAEQPSDVAFADVRAALIRSLLLLVAGLALAVVASLFLARRMVRPIQALQASAARIGHGALDERIELRTGDELEALADEFNQMTAKLRESYATLEHKVEQRTRELAEKSEQLEVVSRHKSAFLANMSHELRTPLNAIIGFSEVLSAQMFGSLNDKQVEYVNDVLESGRHLLELINDILDLSKVEAGRMELQLETFSLAEALERGINLMQERAARRQVELSLEVDDGEDGMSIAADERKVKQIVFNLLSNAVKFTEPGGRVDVRAGTHDGEVRVSVRDTGIGIAPDDLERIFGEFEQVTSGPARSQEGTGLGLALTRRLVELHGGRIWVESAVGAGSTFTFSLPRGAGAGAS